MIRSAAVVMLSVSRYVMLKTLYIGSALICLWFCLLANYFMVRYCLRHSAQLFWEEWRYHLLPGLILLEYRRAARAHEPDGIGVWFVVYLASFVSLIAAGLMLIRL